MDQREAFIAESKAEPESSTSCQSRLIAQYKPKTCPPWRDVWALLAWLSKNWDVAELPMSTFPGDAMERLRHNAASAITNREPQLPAEQFSFTARRLLPTERNRPYLAELQQTGGREGYVVFEEHTGYFVTNLPRLHLELILAQGLHQEDFDHNTPFLLQYVSCRAFWEESYQGKGN